MYMLLSNTLKKQITLDNRTHVLYNTNIRIKKEGFWMDNEKDKYKQMIIQMINEIDNVWLLKLIYSTIKSITKEDW